MTLRDQKCSKLTVEPHEKEAGPEALQINSMDSVVSNNQVEGTCHIIASFGLYGFGPTASSHKVLEGMRQRQCELLT